MITRPKLLSAIGALLVSTALPIRASAADAIYDRTSFDAVINATTRHKQVFASTVLGDGAVLHYMRNSLIGYADGLGEGPGTLKAVAVLYGTSLSLACDDEAWNALHLGEYLRAQGERVPVVAGNPYKTQVAELASLGASFFVCNNALKNFSTQISAGGPLLGVTTSKEARERMIASLLPGTLLVPAGVTALDGLQEKHFTLVQATIG